jgi:hypothetical protein
MLYDERSDEALSRLTRMVPICLLTAVTLVAGCAGFGNFSFTEESGEQTIEGGTLAGSLLPFDPFTFNVNLQQELQKRDAGPAKAVNLTGLNLRVTDTEEPDGDSDDFGFMESITLYANADGEERQRIAWKDPVPAKDQFSFETDPNVNLKPYIEKGMKLETEASGNRPDDDTSMKAEITLRVKTLSE